MLSSSMWSLLSMEAQEVDPAPSPSPSPTSLQRPAMLQLMLMAPDGRHENSEQTHLLMVILAISYGLLCGLAALMIAYLRYNRNVALRGDPNAARKVLLPAFEPLLVLFTAVSFVYTVVFVALSQVVPRDKHHHEHHHHEHHEEQEKAINYLDFHSHVQLEVFLSGRLFILVLTVVFLFHKSVSLPALARASLVSFVVAVVNIPIVWSAYAFLSHPLSFYVTMVSRMSVLGLFIWVLIKPPARASLQSLREFVGFMIVYYVLLFCCNEMIFLGNCEMGFYFATANILWGTLSPFIIWRVLQADTEHWRGLGRRAVSLQQLFRQRRDFDERISSKGLHVLIEMHRKYIIDFAYLELKHRIGTGCSAVVFNGLLHSKIPVAIKVYTPTELDEETVAEYSHEAALCGYLHHPNIVKFYGICVCPPTISLVSELCLGNLQEITSIFAPQYCEIACTRQLSINVAYMLDAARAVAYLHSFSPAFLHRDIKPGNFLVNVNGVVKLTDFGESRSLPRNATSVTGSAIAATGRSNGTHRTNPDSTSSSLEEEDGGRFSVRNSLNSNRTTRMTIIGTADYMAPEVIQGKAGTAIYGEAADIYSLGITFWDVLHPCQEKYPGTGDGQNHLAIYEEVVTGARPPLKNEQFPSVLHCLLQDMWHPSPEQRPSAKQVVRVLEGIQEGLCAEIGSTLMQSLDRVLSHPKNEPRRNRLHPKLFTGQLLVNHIMCLEFVMSIPQAVRMGNGLMNAGFLHHYKHLCFFQNSSSERYFFDEEGVGLPSDLMLDSLSEADLQIVLEKQDESNDTNHSDSSRSNASYALRCAMPPTENSSSGYSVATTNHTTAKVFKGTTEPHCTCRKLGQGVDALSNNNRLFFKKKKGHCLLEEDTLTKKLLHDTSELSGALTTGTFDGFDYSGIQTDSNQVSVTVEPAQPNVDRPKTKKSKRGCSSASI